MATVDGLTKARMLAIEANSVVDGDINGSGNLILFRHDGTPIDAGHVVGTPGVSITSSVIDQNGDLIITYSSGAIVNVGRVEGSDAPAHKVTNYNRGVNYVPNDIVSFAGRLYKSKTANIEKRPPFYTADWEVISNTPNGWVQTDPFFLRKDWDQWELFWSTGNIGRAYTSVAGEFVTGHRALKLTIPAGGSQRMHPKELNLVGGGERVVSVVKARTLTVSANVTIVGTLYQAGEDGHPEPFGSGSVENGSDEGAQAVGQSWKDFTFSNTAISGRPQARANFIVYNNGTQDAEVLIDQIYTRSDVYRSQELFSGTNLNDIRTAGTYMQTDSAEAIAGLNYPIVGAGGLLEVFRNNDGSRVNQRFTPNGVNGESFYQRVYYAGTWYAWKKFSSESEWQSYTPQFLSTTTNPTLGNSTVVGRYCQQGKTVMMNVDIVFGSTFSAGSGAYRITLPVTPHNLCHAALQALFIGNGDHQGHARIEGSAGNQRIQFHRNGFDSMLAFGSTYLTPVSGNRLTIWGTYEAG